MPQGAKRVRYTSMEERCTACEVYGGDEQPCMGEGERGAYQSEHGRPCPRVLLHPDNAEAWALFSLGMNESVARFLATRAGALLVDEQLAGMSREEATEVSRRAVNAMQDSRVWEAMYPEPKKDGAS